MRIFDPEHPFTKSVDQAIRRQGGICDFVTRNSKGERIVAGWFPKMKHELLIHDPTADLWEECGASDDCENLMLYFDSDGRTLIQQGDDDLVYLETTLRAGDEIEELTDFYQNTKAEAIGSSALVLRSLKSLIEGVFLLIPGESEPSVIPLKGIDFARKHPEMTKMLDAFFVSDDLEELSDVRYWCLGSFLDDHGLRGSLPQRERLREGDIPVSEWGEMLYAGIFEQNGHSQVGSSPTLIIRVRPDVSRMWMTDYLQFSIENGDLLKDLVHYWKNLDAWLSKVEIRIPSMKRDQVASSISRRLIRYRYQNRVRALVTVREPFDQIIPLYRKRLRAVDALHTELLDDLDAIQQPLPFFLEYPFRHFRKEDDHLQKVRAGQRLLGILAKVPLFLVVEELLSVGHTLGSVILEKLEERAPSDGALVAFQKLVAEELGTLEASPLVMFPSLQLMMKDTAHLDAMVTARNRMHHEPYDEDGFLQAMSERAPQVVDALRGALHECRFIVPLHGKVLNGEKIIIAEDACNSDAHFRMIELNVTLPLENFPSGELMVWSRSPEQALKLGKLLTSKLVTRQSRDFGIFDRMQKNERHFTFLRSD